MILVMSTEELLRRGKAEHGNVTVAALERLESRSHGYGGKADFEAFRPAGGALAAYWASHEKH